MTQFPTLVHAPYILRAFASWAERGTREGKMVCIRRAPAARRHGEVCAEGGEA